MTYSQTQKTGYTLEIAGLLAGGLLCIAGAMPGYLNAYEKAAIGGVGVEYPAPYRKLTLAALGLGLLISAWTRARDEEDYAADLARFREEYHAALLEQQEHERQLIEAKRQAEIEVEAIAHRQLVMMQKAEEMIPYLPAMEATLEEAPKSLPAAQDAQPVQYATSAPAPAQPLSQSVPQEESDAEDGVKYLQNATEYTSLIYGGQGAGKSWQTREIIKWKLEAGHVVVLLDPHGSRAESTGIIHIGAGMNYEAIGEYLEWYIAECHRRYEEYNASGLTEEAWERLLRRQGKVISTIGEEMTNWARIPGNIAGDAIQTAMSDSRKALMPFFMSAHDRTMKCLGDAKGLSGLRDAALLEIEVFAKVCPQRRKPVSSGKAAIKFPGHGGPPIEFTLPKLERKIIDFTPFVTNEQAIDTLPRHLITGAAKPVIIPVSAPGTLRKVEDQPQDYVMAQAQAIAAQIVQAQAALPAQAPTAQPVEPVEPVAVSGPTYTDDQQALIEYLGDPRRAGGVTLRALKKNWGYDRGLKAAEVSALVVELEDMGVVAVLQQGQTPETTKWGLK